IATPFPAAQRLQPAASSPVIARPADPPETLPTSRGGGGMAAESSIGNDGSRWLGVTGNACVVVGPACVGALARLATTQPSTGAGQSRRWGIDVLLGAGVPFSVGRAILTPGAAIGLGWLRSRSAPDGGGATYDEDDTGGLRLEAGLSLAYPLSRSLSITV